MTVVRLTSQDQYFEEGLNIMAQYKIQSNHDHGVEAYCIVMTHRWKDTQTKIIMSRCVTMDNREAER